MYASCTALMQLQAMYDRLMRYRTIMVCVIVQPNFEGDHAGEGSLFTVHHAPIQRAEPHGVKIFVTPATYARTV